jgi:hypothetical protein
MHKFQKHLLESASVQQRLIPQGLFRQCFTSRTFEPQDLKEPPGRMLWQGQAGQAGRDLLRILSIWDGLMWGDP